jgi:hypothetical protein
VGPRDQRRAVRAAGPRLTSGSAILPRQEGGCCGGGRRYW